MFGYKCVDSSYKGIELKVGKKYDFNNVPLEILDKKDAFSFHSELEEALSSCNCQEAVVYEVEALGDVNIFDGYRCYTSVIRIVREIPRDELAKMDFKKDEFKIYFKDYNLPDRELLKKYYSQSKSRYQVRYALVRTLKDLDLLFYTFKDDKDWLVRVTIVDRMTDLNLMYKTFKNDREYIVRDKVLDRLEEFNPEYIKKAKELKVFRSPKNNSTKNNKDDPERKERSKMIADELNYGFFKNDKNCFVRAELVAKLNDLELVKTFQDDESELVRNMVKKRLQNLK